MSDDTRARVAAPGWYSDDRGDLRWWNGQGWTEHVTPGAYQPVGATVTPASRSDGRRRRGWVAAGVIVALVCVVAVVAAAVMTLSGPLRDTMEQAADMSSSGGTPGYFTYTGPSGQPLRVGAPYGRPCVPIVLNVEDSVPDAVYREIVAVATEARTAGIAITVETRRHTWRPAELYPPGLTNADVIFIPVFADTDAGHVRSDGQPSTHSMGWDAALEADGRHEHLTSVKATLHLATLGDDPREYRRSLRLVVGRTQGIADSSAAGSALHQRDPTAPDAFSATDITAMQTMSGCGQGQSPPNADGAAAGIPEGGQAPPGR